MVVEGCFTVFFEIKLLRIGGFMYVCNVMLCYVCYGMLCYGMYVCICCTTATKIQYGYIPTGCPTSRDSVRLCPA